MTCAQCNKPLFREEQKERPPLCYRCSAKIPLRLVNLLELGRIGTWRWR